MGPEAKETLSVQPVVSADGRSARLLREERHDRPPRLKRGRMSTHGVSVLVSRELQ